MADGTSDSITITFNGQPMQLPAGSSICDLLEFAQIRSKLVAVEVNLEIVPRQEHQAYIVQAGDAIEAVTLVGGG